MSDTLNGLFIFVVRLVIAIAVFSFGYWMGVTEEPHDTPPPIVIVCEDHGARLHTIRTGYSENLTVVCP